MRAPVVKPEMPKPKDGIYNSPETIIPAGGDWMNERTKDARDRLKTALGDGHDLLQVPVNSLDTLHHKVSRKTTTDWITNAQELAGDDKELDAFNEFDPEKDNPDGQAPGQRLTRKQAVVHNLLSNLELGPSNPLADAKTGFDPNTEPIDQASAPAKDASPAPPPGEPQQKSHKHPLKRQLTPRSLAWQEAAKAGEEGDKHKKAGNRDAALSEYRKAAESIKKAEEAHQAQVEKDFEIAGGEKPSGKQNISIPKTEQWREVKADPRPLNPDPEESGNITQLADGTIKVILRNGNSVAVGKVGEHEVREGEMLGYHRKPLNELKEKELFEQRVGDRIKLKDKGVDAEEGQAAEAPDIPSQEEIEQARKAKEENRKNVHDDEDQGFGFDLLDL